MRFRCPKCRSEIRAGSILGGSGERVIACHQSGQRSVRAFNERATFLMSLWGGVGWFLGLIACYGVGYEGLAMLVASITGIVAALIAASLFAIRLREVPHG